MNNGIMVQYLFLIHQALEEIKIFHAATSAILPSHYHYHKIVRTIDFLIYRSDGFPHRD